jgi:hypothetical protein
MAQKRRKNRKSAANATARALDPHELQIPDSVIEQILEEMKIPAESWDPAAYKVSDAVESCIKSFIDGRLGEHESRYEMIATLCKRLRRELSKLNNSERRHFSANLQDFEKNLDGIESAASFLIVTWRSGHRPPDSVKCWPRIRQALARLRSAPPAARPIGGVRAPLSALPRRI